MKKLAIFAAFDKDEIVDDYVVFYIKELAKSADVIAVFDNTLSEKEREKIAPFCLEILAAKHGEYDFGSYKRGFIYAKSHKILANYDKLVLCNDSVFGPFYSFEQIFAQIPQNENAIWGFAKHLRKACHGWAGREFIEEHLQSYFLVLPPKAFLHPKFTDFMHSIKRLENKDEIIFQYEIGLSQMLKGLGFELQSRYESSDDLSVYSPFEVLNRHQGAFLKRNFIYHNDFFTICKTFDYACHHANGGGYDINLMLSHYEKMGDQAFLIRQSELEKFKDEAQKFHRLSKKVAKFAKFIPIKSTREKFFKKYIKEDFYPKSLIPQKSKI